MNKLILTTAFIALTSGAFASTGPDLPRGWQGLQEQYGCQPDMFVRIGPNLWSNPTCRSISGGKQIIRAGTPPTEEPPTEEPPVEEPPTEEPPVEPPTEEPPTECKKKCGPGKPPKPPKEGQNPGNDKPVGGSPFDGEQGEEPSGRDEP